jgi:hypothetical protein
MNMIDFLAFDVVALALATPGLINLIWKMPENGVRS